MNSLFPETVVVNVRNADHYEHYVGRPERNYSGSAFQNPFFVGFDGDREEVILKFVEYWYDPKQKSLRDGAADILFGIGLLV